MNVIDKTNEQLIAELEWANTGQTRIKEERREIEAFSYDPLENLPGVVIITDMDSAIRYANPALERLAGFTLAEVIGKKAPYPWWIWTESPVNADKPAPIIYNRVRTQEFYRKKNGETFWAEVTSVPVRRDGEMQYYLYSWVDVTEHKQADKQIIEINLFFKSILDNTAYGILVTDKNDVISYGNKRIGEITGMIPEKLYGKAIFVCSLEKLVGFTRNHYIKAKKTLQPLNYLEIPAVTPDG